MVKVTFISFLSHGSDEVPEELAEPFYRDQYNQEHLKPPVACLLQSAELYCRAGSLILRSDAVKPLLGHNAVIQALAQKGLYVTDQDRLVTERDLTSTPIHMVSKHVPDGSTIIIIVIIIMQLHHPPRFVLLREKQPLMTGFLWQHVAHWPDMP